MKSASKRLPVSLLLGTAELYDLVQMPHGHDPREVRDHFPVVGSLRLGQADQAAHVRIIALLPSPPGNENQNEEVKPWI